MVRSLDSRGWVASSRRHCPSLGLLVLTALLGGLTTPAAEAQTVQWTARKDGPGGDPVARPGSNDAVHGKRAVAVGPGGRVFVTGSVAGSGDDWLTIAYDASGAVLWSRWAGGAGNGDDDAYALAVDTNGGVAVVGRMRNGSGNDDFAVVHYSGTGSAWQRTADGTGAGDDRARAVTVDGAGRVLATGYAWNGTNNDFLTICYDGSGTEQWRRAVNGAANGDDLADAVAVDATGNVYVTGSSSNGSNFDILTVAYDSSGTLLWSRVRPGVGGGHDAPTSMVIDGGGHEYVTGYSWNGANYDFLTVAYDAAGNELWARVKNGPANAEDAAYDLAVDGSGHVVVTGYSANPTAYDYLTVAYDGAGTELWTRLENGIGNSFDSPWALGVDAAGDVFVTGYSSDGTTNDFLTVCYDAAGTRQWGQRRRGVGATNAYAFALAVDPAGKVVVSGVSTATNDDFLTVAYDLVGNELWTRGEAALYRHQVTGVHQIESSFPQTLVVAGNRRYVVGTASTSSGAEMLVVAYDQAGNELWSRYAYRPGGGTADTAFAATTDAAGNLYVTGQSYGNGIGGAMYDAFTVAYDSAGNELWSRLKRVPGSTWNATQAIVVTPGGLVVATGEAIVSPGSWDYLTVAYDLAGNEQWTQTENGSGNSEDYATAISANASEIVVAGMSLRSGGNDLLTVAYDAAGSRLWSRTVLRSGAPSNNGPVPPRFAPAMSMAGGLIAVTGVASNGSNFDFLTVAYDSAGNQLWLRQRDGAVHSFDAPRAIATRPDGTVFVTGESYNGSNYDFLTVAYDAAGTEAWAAVHDGGGGWYDTPSAIALAPDGSPVVTGRSETSGQTNRDYLTVSYDLAGVERWALRTDAGAEDVPTAVGVGPDGAVVVAGWSLNSDGNLDMLTEQIAGDATTPTAPTLGSPVPVAGSWTTDDTIDLSWSGAADEPGGSGLAGYSVLWDQAAATTPDTTIEVVQATDPHGATSPPLADAADWYVHVRACDTAGNCSSAVHAGPFEIDTTSPSAPGLVSSSSHGDGQPHADATVDVAWGAASDARSGVTTYRYGFDGSLSAPACATLGSTTAGTSVVSAPLADGTWYAHVCALDAAGNAGAVATGGPYVVAVGPPSNPTALDSTSHTVDGWSNDPTIDVAWSGASDAPGGGGLDGYWLSFDAAPGSLVGVSIPVGSMDGTSHPTVDNVYAVDAPPYPLDTSLGIGYLVSPTWTAPGELLTLHDHQYTSPYVPNPAQAQVTYAFDRPVVVDQLEVVQHNNGISRVEGFVGDSLATLTSIGTVWGPSGDVTGPGAFGEGQVQVFSFGNTTAGRYFRFVVRKTSLYNGWANYRVFPRDAHGVRFPAATAAAPATGSIFVAESDPHVATSAALGDGRWYVQLRTCNLAGMCAEWMSRGPWGVDTTVPGAPGAVSSSSHGDGQPHLDPTVDIAWGAASDATSGVAAYRYGFDGSAAAPDCGDLATVTAATSASSAALANGTWYVHVCVEDAAGNRGAVVTGGPYVVAVSPPSGLLVSSTSHVASTWSNDATIDFTFNGATSGVGVAGYSLVFDELPGTDPDATVDQAGITYTGTASPDGNDWYLHVRACDTLGLCGGTVHAGPFWIDTTAPSAAIPWVAEGQRTSAIGTPLSVTFGETMANAGAADQYHLVLAGADGTIETASCGAVATSDVEVPLSSVTYSPVPSTAYLDVSVGYLGSGIYRLLVCGSLVDPAGNSLAGGDLLRTFEVDATAPRIVQFGSIADTGDGRLAVHEATNVAVTALSVTFDEAMFEPIVTDPHSYRLLSPGPDGFQTRDCDQYPGDPGDPAIPITAATYEAATHTAVLSLNAPLPDGEYRLILCSTPTPVLDLVSNGLSEDVIHTFQVDTAAPSAPSPVVSPSHGDGLPKPDPAIEVAWTDADDPGSGVLRYRSELSSTASAPSCSLLANVVDSGAQVVKDVRIPLPHGLGRLTRAGDRVFFMGSDQAGDYELWVSDGTESGTHRVKDIVPGPGGSGPYPLAPLGTRLLFSTSDALWVSDGTEAGTFALHDFDSQVLTLAANGNIALFSAYFGGPSRTLWVTDGTPGGTHTVNAIDPWGGLVPFGAGFLLSGSDPTHVAALWYSDGTGGGTELLAPLGADFLFDRSPVEVGGRVFFSGFDSATGRELYVTDGTAAGTQMVADVQAGSDSSAPQFLARLGDVVLFTATDDAHGTELWRSDGSAAGTQIISDLAPGADSSNPRSLRALADTLYFWADDGAHGTALWRSDGTAAGTQIAVDLDLSPFGAGFVQVGQWLYFSACGSVDGCELWRTDGSEQGTRRVLDIGSGPDSSWPSYLTPLGSDLLFSAYDRWEEGENPSQLWKASFVGGITSTPLADGTWYAHVCAVDAAGNESPVATGGPYVVDTTGPTGLDVTSTTHTLSAWSNAATVSFLFSGATDANGVVGYAVAWDESAATAPGCAATQSGTSFDSPAAPDGNDWYVHVRAVDAAGNCGATVTVGPFWIDTTSPSSPGAVTSSSHGDGQPHPDPTVDVSWGAASDALSGVSSYRYGFEGLSSAPACSSLASASTGTSASSSSLADGTWYVHVCAVDAAGNESAAVTGGPYVIDTTGPSGLVVDSTSHAPSTWSSDATIDFVFAGATDPSGVVGYSLVFDASAGTDPDATVEQAVTSFTGTATPDGSSWYLHVRACDGLGTCGATVHAGPYWIDTAPPAAPTGVGSSSHAVGVPSTEPVIVLTWTPAADAGSGVAGYEVRFDHASSSACSNLANAGAGAISASSPVLAPGSWYGHVCAADALGHWSAVADAGPYQLTDPASPAGTELFVVSYTAGRIDRMGTDGSGVAPVIPSGSSVGVAVDPVAQKLYYIATGDWVIRRTDLDGSNPADVVAVDPGSHDLAVSHLHDRIVWTEGLSAIRSVHLDGSGPQTLASGGLAFPGGVTIDGSGAGTVYWADFLDHSLNRVGLDGSGRALVLSTGSLTPYSVTVDAASQVLYWTSAGSFSIHRVAVDGSGDTELFAGGTDGPADIDIDPVSQHLFWAEESGQRVLRGRTDGTGLAVLVGSEGHNRYGIAVLTVDALAPTDPSFDSVMPTPGAWTAIDTVSLGWSGAADPPGGSGLAGYSIEVDHQPAGSPDHVVDVPQGTDPHAWTSGVLADGGDWYAHLAACDLAGNCTSTIHAGPFRIDTTAPSAAGALSSASHGSGAPISDAMIEIAWGAASDALSGVASYRYGFDGSAATPACTSLGDSTLTTAATSAPLADGTWYAHLCAVDAAGNEGPVATGGPYVIDTGAPTGLVVSSTSHGGATWSSDPTVDFLFSGATDASGVAGYSLAFDRSPSTVPDATPEQAGTSFTATSSPDANDWWLHVRACDVAGNCGSTVDAGPFWIDTIAPSAPGSLGSTSHTVGVASGDPTIDLTWTTAADVTSGVSGYAVRFDGSATATCDQVVDETGGATSSTSNPLASGDWYGHVCAVDAAGNWGPVVSAGPYTLDGTAPTTASVLTVASAGGPLGEGALLDVGVTQLLVGFSEPMATAGAGSAAATANYRLFAAGPDGILDSTSCGAPVGDDLAVAIGGASYLAASCTTALALDPTTALLAGSYRLLACGSLSDAQGNPLDGNGDSTPGDDFARRFTVRPTDLLTNPNFDLGTSGWTLLGNPGELSWQTADAGTAPTSGSAQLVSLVGSGQTHALAQCVAVAAGSHYRAFGVTRVASAVSGQPRVGIRLDLYPTADCSGAPTATVAGSQQGGATGAGWQRLESTALAPVGTQSLRLRLVVDDTAGDGAFDVDVDSLMLHAYVELLFANGFEVGSTAGWSGSVGGP